MATEEFNKKYCIGSGGYGEVYKCQLPELANNTVAVKRIISRDDDEGIEGFRSEVKMLSKCKHPNIVSLVGFCDEDNEMLLVYEYVSNGSLDDHLRNLNLTWAQRLKMCIDIATGLNYLHTSTEDKERIIHRDIKSANILLGENWEAKIADFGLSKFHPGNQHGSTIKTNHIAGTEVYWDPEYARTGRLKKASDVYSFGVVLFEIFTGTLAYDSSNTREHEKGLAPIARRHFQTRTLKGMLDPKIMEEAYELGFTGKVGPAHDSLKGFLKIAYQCLAYSQTGRPSTEVVITELNKALSFQETRIKTLRISLEDLNLGICITTGEYGMLYKGTFQYNNRHKKVNIKQFTGAEHDFFLKEFEILFRYKQENITGLVGYCEEKNENYIVYEHASNGSLDKYLNDTSFSWKKRLEVCIGIAKGLNFLHGGDLGQDVVVHRDLKCSNILLNKYWKAKICGFEHALTYSSNKEIEYLENDIYSFGMILFEILCGRLACPEGYTDRSQFLVTNLEGVEEKVFEGIKRQIAQESLDTFSKIAFQCLQREMKKRPTASEVVGQLQRALKYQEDYEYEFHRKYEEILECSKSPEIDYYRMVKTHIKELLSNGILLQEQKEDIIQDILAEIT